MRPAGRCETDSLHFTYPHFFARGQLYWLRLVVAERQADPATRGPGIVFAHPAIGPKNSVGGPEALLYSPDPPADIDEWGTWLARGPWAAGLQLNPDDPMAEDRRAACAAYRDRVQEHPVESAPLHCRIGAIGHPDPDGAARYRDEVLVAWARARRIALRDDLARVALDGTGSSLRAGLVRYGMNAQELSLQGTWQHMQVDCLAVEDLFVQPPAAAVGQLQLDPVVGAGKRGRRGAGPPNAPG